MGLFNRYDPDEVKQSDLDALKEAGYDTSDAGKGNSAMKASDVAKMTEVSSREAAAAAHAARDDYEKDEGLGDRHQGGWKK